MSESEPAASVVDELADSVKEQVIISAATTDNPCPTSESSGEAIQSTESNSQDDNNVKTSIPSASAPPAPPAPATDFHLVKWIDFNFETLPILLQNINGPCPLLAIFNVLLLRKRVKFSSND